MPGPEALDIDGFRQVVRGADLHAAHGARELRILGDEDQLDDVAELAVLDEGDVLRPEHVVVDQGDVRHRAEQRGAGLLQGAHAPHRETGFAEHVGQPYDGLGVVGKDQRLEHGASGGLARSP